MDIFDRIMRLGFFKPLFPFYTRYKEQLLYLFFGALTTVVSIVSFAAAESILGLDTLIANIISWVCAVAFAYVTNRTWVFKNKAHDKGAVFKEALSFAAGRLFTLGLEEFILLAGVKWLRIPSIIVKIAAQIIVLIGNYIISKFIVFRTKKSAENQTLR